MDAVAPAKAHVLRTGLRALDALVGPPQGLWLVTGPRGVGKTQLALGFARVTLGGSHAVQWLTTADPPPERLVQVATHAQARVVLPSHRVHPLTDEERVRLQRAQEALRDAQLLIEAQDPNDVLARAQSLVEQRDAPDLLVLDTAPFEIDALRRLRQHAHERRGWVVAVLVEEPDRRLVELREVADVLLHVDRPDLHDPATERVGETDIGVWSSGRSRRQIVTVAYQARFGRFVDITPV